MNHQPFRDWLLVDEPLTEAQSRSLQEHLAECDSCSQIAQSWQQAERAIKSAPEVAPEPGFTQRWQVHLAEYERHQQKRQGWVSIGITAILAVALIVILGIQVWPILKDPIPLVTTWLSQVIALISDFYILRTLFTTSTWLKPVNMLIGSFFLVGIVSFMSVLWFTVYQKFNLSRRIE